jgi:hypothetical protein
MVVMSYRKNIDIIKRVGEIEVGDLAVGRFTANWEQFAFIGVVERVSQSSIRLESLENYSEGWGKGNKVTLPKPFKTRWSWNNGAFNIQDAGLVYPEITPARLGKIKEEHARKTGTRLEKKVTKKPAEPVKKPVKKVTKKPVVKRVKTVPKPQKKLLVSSDRKRVEITRKIQVVLDFFNIKAVFTVRKLRSDATVKGGSFQVKEMPEKKLVYTFKIPFNLPERFENYIITHEAVHLVRFVKTGKKLKKGIRSHDALFYAYCDKYQPDFYEVEREFFELAAVDQLRKAIAKGKDPSKMISLRVGRHKYDLKKMLEKIK